MNTRKFTLQVGIALAVTVSLCSGLSAYAISATPTSDYLPVINSLNGATADYLKSNNAAIQSFTTAGDLDSTAQQASADAANNALTKTLRFNVNAGVAEIGCDSFNVGAGKVVNYNFTGSNQVALTRVTTNIPSNIFGTINQTGSGTVFLINPNGILFGKGSSVNVSSFAASTLNVKSYDAIANKLELDRGSNSPAGIYIEKGSNINALNNVALISNAIYNGGNIKAYDKTTGNYGNVALVTADGVTFDFINNTYTAKGSSASDDNVTFNNSTTAPLGSISTTGSIKGNNILVASYLDKSLASPVNNIVNLEGTVTANAVIGGSNGDIYVYADNADISGNTGITIAGSVKSNGGAVTLDADGDINIKTAVKANDTVSLSSGKDINLYTLVSSSKGDVEFISGNDINLINPNIEIETSSNTAKGYVTASNGNISFTAGNNISIDQHSVLSSNTAYIVNANDFNLNGSVITKSDANFHSGNDFNMNANSIIKSSNGIVSIINLNNFNMNSIIESAGISILSKNADIYGTIDSKKSGVLIGTLCNLNVESTGRIMRKGPIALLSLGQISMDGLVKSENSSVIVGALHGITSSGYITAPNGDVFLLGKALVDKSNITAKHVFYW